jgi:hypothetical protein
MSKRSDRLKRLATEIYAESDKLNRCKASYCRRKAVRALPDDERVDVNYYISLIGRARQKASVRHQFRATYAIAKDQGKVS